MNDTETNPRQQPQRPTDEHFLIGAALLLISAGICGWTAGGRTPEASLVTARPPPEDCPTLPVKLPGIDDKHPLDCSGRPRQGIASFYARRFGGRTMADGTPMHLGADNAASRTLPLGTTAIVTNLQTGLTAHVTIRDRGPYVDGRLIDLSPATARKIGLEPRQGLARVEVAPIQVPLPDGTVRRGTAWSSPGRTRSAG
jgi:rare lipoprotein A